MKVRWFIVLAMLSLSQANTAEALTIRRPLLKELLTNAKSIVLAEVKSTTQESTPQGIPIICTTFKVLRTFKGTPQKSVQIRLPGGQTKAYRIRLGLLPRFRLKSQVYLLLRPSKANPKQPILAGLYYGVFDVFSVRGKPKVSHRGKLIPAVSQSTFEGRILSVVKKENHPLHRSSKRKKPSSSKKKK